MNDLTLGSARSRLAVEFEKRGWEYDLTAGRSVLEAAEAGLADPAALAERVPAEFLARNQATRAEVAAAIEGALGGSIPRREDRTATIVIDNQIYSVDLGGAQITHSNVNIGPGTQINVDASARKDDALAAVAAVVAAGLAGDWNADAVRELAAALDARDDVALEDIEKVTAEVVEAEQPTQGRVRDLLTQIAVSGIGGALSTAISSALGGVLPHLPI